MYNYVVRLNNVKIRATHGLHQHEKSCEQLFEVDLEAYLIKRETCRDDINNSLDYEKIYKIVLNVFKNNTFNLIETIGEEIIHKVFNDNNIESMTVTIRKPQIKFDNNSNCVEVSISKKNE